MNKQQKFEFIILPSVIIIGIALFILFHLAGLPNEFVYHFDASGEPDYRMSPITYLVVNLFLQNLIIAFVTAIEYGIRKTNNVSFLAIGSIRFVKFFILGIFFSVTQQLIAYNLTGDKISEFSVFGIATIMSLVSVALITIVNNRADRAV